MVVVVDLPDQSSSPYRTYKIRREEENHNQPEQPEEDDSLPLFSLFLIILSLSLSLSQYFLYSLLFL